MDPAEDLFEPVAFDDSGNKRITTDLVIVDQTCVPGPAILSRAGSKRGFLVH